MRLLDRFRLALSSRVWASLILLAGTATLAFAQLGPSSPPPAAPRTRLEYLNQDVPASTLVMTMNDLDAQGWEIFQVVPVWSFQKDADDQSRLVPSSYQLFGRRPLRAPK